MPESAVPHVPGHENWFHCDGEKDRGTCTDTPACSDGPRGARYEFPLPKIPGAPVPSKANYSPENVAWMIEMFASIISPTRDESEICFRYENNDTEGRCLPVEETENHIEVCHPGDKLYFDEHADCNRPKSIEQERYEVAAKKSALLKLYEENSPANIQYFNPICEDAS